MNKKITEAEVRFRILQALDLSPKLTIGMLQAFLTSRVPNNVRDAVLGLMAKEGRVRFESRVFHSFYGHTSVVKVVVAVKAAAVTVPVSVPVPIGSETTTEATGA